jgi:hypothetical protein
MGRGNISGKIATLSRFLDRAACEVYDARS